MVQLGAVPRQFSPKPVGSAHQKIGAVPKDLAFELLWCMLHSMRAVVVASLACFVGAFVPGPRRGLHAHPTHALMAEPADRRHFFEAVSGAASALALMTTPSSAGAIVYLDPARYGDQELKVAAVAYRGDRGEARLVVKNVEEERVALLEHHLHQGQFPVKVLTLNLFFLA